MTTTPSLHSLIRDDPAGTSKAARRLGWNISNERAAILAAALGVLDDADTSGYRLSLRSVYYGLVSTNVVPNSERSYKNLSALLTRAREAGMIPLTALDDRNRVARVLDHWQDGPDLLRQAAGWYASDLWRTSPVRVEVWCEKAALSGILEPVADRYRVPYLACRGFSSVTALGEALERWHEQEAEEVKVLYVGDYDPSGAAMDADLVGRLEYYAAVGGTAVDVQLERVALTREQIEEHNLPPQPTKMTDTRALGWTEDGSWEADALPADVLDQVVDAAISELLPDDFEELREADLSTSARIRELAESW